MDLCEDFILFKRYNHIEKIQSDVKDSNLANFIAGSGMNPKKFDQLSRFQKFKFRDGIESFICGTNNPEMIHRYKYCEPNFRLIINSGSPFIKYKINYQLNNGGDWTKKFAYYLAGLKINSKQIRKMNKSQLENLTKRFFGEYEEFKDPLESFLFGFLRSLGMFIL